MFYQAKILSGKFFVCIKKAEILEMMFGEQFLSFPTTSHQKHSNKGTIYPADLDF